MISRVVADVLEELTKQAEIKTSPRQLFTYVPFPEDLRQKFEEVAKHVVPEGKVARDIDHCTLLYIPKAEADVAHERIDEILKAIREVCENVKPIHCKVQGWGYFDGAEEDGVKKTALVALLDAPGLEDLHVELKSTMKRLGLKDAGTHIFTPHVTFAYLPQGERVKDLPLLDGEFDIDKVMFANADKHEVPLLGDKSIGQKAAAVTGFQGLLDWVDEDNARKRGVSVEEVRRQEDAKTANEHHITKCSCGATISQCRCPSPNKEQRVVKDGCHDCQAKQAGCVVEGDEPALKALFDRLHRALNNGRPMPEKNAARVDRCKVCGKKATVKVLWAEAHGYQPACEAHKEQVAKPFKAKDDFSGFKKYKTAAHIDELREALKRIGLTRLNQKSSWLGPHMNPKTMSVMMPAGGAVKNFDIWDMPRPSTPAGQKATNILGGMHEGIERAVTGRHGGAPPGFHGHASPRVLMDESNMLAALRGPGTEEAKRTFGAMRGVESPEAQEITQAVSRLSGGRMPFQYGETKLPKALKERLDASMRTR